jgi:hypothetical protein
MVVFCVFMVELLVEFIEVVPFVVVFDEVVLVVLAGSGAGLVKCSSQSPFADRVKLLFKQ